MTIFYALLAGAILFFVWRMIRDRRGYIDANRPTPDYDPSEGQPEAPEALELLRSEDWNGLIRLYGRLAPSDRYHLVQSLGQMAPPPNLPDDADSALLTIAGGMRLIHGLRLQGRGSFRAVIQANLPRMKQAISEADRELREASAQAPDDSTTLAFQILAEINGMRDQARINNLVGRVGASGEANIYAALNHLLANAPALGHPANAMWRVANEWANAGHNAAFLAIPARAHIEEWRFAMFSCPPASPERETMISLLQDDDFRRHLAALDDKFWSALGRENLSGAEHVFAHNHFAFLMHTQRVDDRAKRHLEQLGGQLSIYPWCLLPTGATRPAQLLADLRRQYGF